MKETYDSQCGCAFEAEDREQLNALRWLLMIIGFMFVGEFEAGLIAGSAALIADSLDMFADAAVYFIGLYAVGKGILVKEPAFMVLVGLAALVANVTSLLIISKHRRGEVHMWAS